MSSLLCTFPNSLGTEEECQAGIIQPDTPEEDKIALLEAEIIALKVQLQTLMNSVSEALDTKVNIQENKGLFPSDGLVLETDERIKLIGIEDLATANQPDDYLLDRQNHFGSQPIESVDGLSEELGLINGILISKAMITLSEPLVDEAEYVLRYNELEESMELVLRNP